MQGPQKAESLAPASYASHLKLTWLALSRAEQQWNAQTHSDGEHAPPPPLPPAHVLHTAPNICIHLVFSWPINALHQFRVHV